MQKGYIFICIDFPDDRLRCAACYLMLMGLEL